MKEKILDVLEKHYHGRNFIESRCADELLDLFGVVGSALLYDLMNEQQEIVSSPIRFNGVHIDKIKQVFDKNGLNYDVDF